MSFTIEIMVFLIISSMIMLFVPPTKEVILSRNNLASDVKQIIEDSDTQKAINNNTKPPEILEKTEADVKRASKELSDNAVIYNKLDQQASQSEYSYNDKRYNVSYTKKTYEGQEIAKDSRWIGNISNFNYKVNNKMKIDRIVEDYFNDILTRNGELDIKDIPEAMKSIKKTDKEEIKYNDKNKLMIIENIVVKDDIEIWEIEYAEIKEIKEIKEEHSRYVIVYYIIKGQIEVEENKDKSDKDNLGGTEYDIDFYIENKINNGIKRNRLILQRG